MSYKYSKGKNKTIGAQTFSNQVETGVITSEISKTDSQILKRIAVTASCALEYSQYFVGVVTTNVTSSIIISLPIASGSTSGRTYVIKDEGGVADINNIIISASSIDTIDGETNITIESPYSSLNIYTNGVSKWFIY